MEIIKGRKGRRTEELFWKIRIKGNIKTWRKDLSKIEDVRRGNCVYHRNVPEWMVRGRTVLIQKDTAKGAQASNYRPIACLPMMWKLLTGVMGEKLYHHLERNGLLRDPEELKINCL